MIKCSVTGCGKEAKVKGMCSGHYAYNWRLKKNKELEEHPIKCRVRECDKPIVSQHMGYCTMHYQRYKRSGTLERKTHPKRPCSVDGCTNMGYGMGDALCIAHKHKLDRYGDPTKCGKDFPQTILCEIPGCITHRRSATRKDAINGGAFCNRHRGMMLRYNLTSFVDAFGEPPYKCAFCGKELDVNSKDINIDHDIPKSKGGTDEMENLQLTCKTCNMAKRDLTSKEFVELCHKIGMYIGKDWSVKE